MVGSSHPGVPHADVTLQKVEELPQVGSYRVLDRYILCSLLGAGGAGAVFMGWHTSLRRAVAVKVLNPELAAGYASAVDRFKREAMLAAQCKSPNIIPVTDAGIDKRVGLHYLVMDLILGENAEERLRRRNNMLQVPEALTIVHGATCGLIDAHHLGILHRDLKPSNIMVASDGHVFLADLGIATSVERPDLQLTQAQETVGTPQYMSPEQIMGPDTDARSDVYSMGVTLHFLLSGTHPFGANSLHAIRQRVVTETLPDLRRLRPDIPDALAGLIARATAHDREARLQDASELLDGIESLMRHHAAFDLADPHAGEQVQGEVVPLSDAQLDQISRSIDELEPATVVSPGKPRSRAWVTVLILLVLMGGGVAGLVWWQNRQTEDEDPKLETPEEVAEDPVAVARERLIDSVDGADEVQMKDAVGRYFEVNPDARDDKVVLDKLERWLTGDGERPASEILGKATPLQEEVAGHLLECDRLGEWMEQDARRLARQEAWEVLDSFAGIDLLRAPTLRAMIINAAYEELRRKIEDDRELGLDAAALKALGALHEKGGREHKGLDRLLAVANLLSREEPEVADVEGALARLKQLEMLPPAELRQSLARLVAVRGTESFSFLRRNQDLLDEGTHEAVGKVATEQLAAGRWDQVLECVRFLATSGADGHRLTALGEQVLLTLKQVEKRDPRSGLLVLANHDAALRLIKELDVQGVTSSRYWLLEATLEWDEAVDAPALRPEGVRPDRLRSLVDEVGSYATDARKGRTHYLCATIALNILDDPQRAVREVSAGVLEQDPGCAAEYILWLLHREARRVAGIQGDWDGREELQADLRDKYGVITALGWESLEAALKAASSGRAKAAYAYGLLAYEGRLQARKIREGRGGRAELAKLIDLARNLFLESYRARYEGAQDMTITAHWVLGQVLGNTEVASDSLITPAVVREMKIDAEIVQALRDYAEAQRKN